MSLGIARVCLRDRQSPIAPVGYLSPTASLPSRLRSNHSHSVRFLDRRTNSSLTLRYLEGPSLGKFWIIVQTRNLEPAQLQLARLQSGVAVQALPLKLPDHD